MHGLDCSAASRGSTATHDLSDGLGSTTELADNTGDVVATYEYDVFGAIRSQSGSSANQWLFTGEQRDSESGFYYLRARYYDPAIARLLSRDPLPGSVFSPLSLNPYAYVLNNPLRWLDPWGLRNVEGSAFRPTPLPPPTPACGSFPGTHCCSTAAEPHGFMCNPGPDPVTQVLDELGDLVGALRSAVTSECGQGLARTAIGTLATAAAASGAGTLIEAGGVVTVSVATSATSAAAVGAAAGPENIQRAVAFLPGGLVQVYENCGF